MLRNLIPSSSGDCFSCDDWDLCTLISSWTGHTDTTSSSSSSASNHESYYLNKSSSLRNEEFRIRHRLDGDYATPFIPSNHRNRFGLKKSRSKGLSSSGASAADHPPPVIALSRSSYSVGSSSSAESALETTEVDRYQDEDKRRSSRRRQVEDIGAARFWLKGRGRRRQGDAVKDDNNDSDDRVYEEEEEMNTKENWMSKNNLLVTSPDMDFAARHELLLNALFEDALHRQVQIGGGAGGASAAMGDKGEAPRPLTTPPRSTRKSSIGTVGDTPGGATTTSGYSKSSLSKSSRFSNSTTGSDLLNPSCHQFTNKLQKTKRKCQHRTLSSIKRKMKQRPSKHLSKKHLYGSSVEGSYSHCAMKRGGKEEASDASSAMLSQETRRSSSAGELARSFLHPVCRLQKDSGKGMEPGTSVSVSGRDEAINKLMEKMDLLAEVEKDGTFVNAVMTRIQARNMTLAKSEVNGGGSDVLWEQGFVETRSMLAVKMGFMSLRYGIMIHWNRQTGLAELIVLRKLCPDSFMKVKVESKSKTWKKRMRRMSAISTATTEETKMSVSS
mmetsp:Transcript_13602/g.25551  ORF Transcript_13602/g.25551 Transcript_13602/m.25551 type:complete len:556 (-) Transcript_13602:127-1794(-)|eukprot:CAMPEP_0176497346 /NCGR_PEP_ID=MMETSP0200_2-20121128/11673_1 /TAXON_ID=947934 /ORGANISM="Chaetoceros sp., Strain GSL56" /LENGTH=555 /DNA_ID=CAMNT_0017895349 /DNA_START=469 /DNA_END=2136 /DNA_ORIENTATION=-